MTSYLFFFFDILSIDLHVGYIPGNETSNGPRPIPKTLYEQICPPEERVYINKTLVEVHRQLNPVNVGTSLDDISGKAVLEAWIDRLNEPDMKDARCVEVTKDSPQIFDIWQVFFVKIIC